MRGTFGAPVMLGACVVGAVVACIVSTDGLTGGADVGDATADTVAPGDAGDAGDAGDGAPFCASRAPAYKFCDDFDEGQAFDFGWDNHDRVDGGSAGLDDAAWASSPASLLVTTPPFDNTSAQSMAEGLDVDLGVSATTSAHAEAAVRVDAAGAQAVLLTVGFGAAPGGAQRYEILVVADPAGAYILEGTPPDAGRRNFVHTPLGTTFAPGRWYRVAVDVSFTPPAMSATVDGRPAVTQQPLASGWQAGLVHLEVGVANYEPQPIPAMQAHLDDVLLDVR
jgi:hypothetical protein